MHSTAFLLPIIHLLLVTLTTSFVIPPKPPTTFDTTHLNSRAEPNPGAVAQLLSIVPTASTCDPAAQFGSECITAHDALQPILNTFFKYGITTAAEQGSLLAWMALETGEFKFNTHHFPSENPGQGTRNMMSPTFVSEYAVDLGLPNAATASAADDLATINKDNDLSFGSAPWFYAKHCAAAVKDAVKTGSQDGFTRFTTECVGTTMTDERLKYWLAAKKALSF